MSVVAKGQDHTYGMRAKRKIFSKNYRIPCARAHNTLGMAANSWFMSFDYMKCAVMNGLPVLHKVIGTYNA